MTKASATAVPEWAQKDPPAPKPEGVELPPNPEATAEELPGGPLYEAAYARSAEDAAKIGKADPWHRHTEAERVRMVTDYLVAMRRAGEQVAREGQTIRGESTGLITAADLLGRRFAEQRWAVPGVIPEGLTILAAKPKLGKSWLMLGVGVAIAAGGRALGLLEVDQGPVLYMALEDTQRRLQGRLVSILDDGEDPPSRLELSTTWRRIDAGGLDDLRDWLTTHPGARLVIVDTLARIRPNQKRKDTRLYDDDYNELVGLKALADEFSLAVVVVHHLRKAKADDPIDQLNASTGMSGAADAILILERGRGDQDAKLHVQGRDVEEAALALRWWPSAGTWTIVDPALADLTAERAEILDYLAQADGPRTPSVAAVALGRNIGSIKRLMWNMGKANQIQGGGRTGYWFTPGEPSEPSEPAAYLLPATQIQGEPGNRERGSRVRLGYPRPGDAREPSEPSEPKNGREGRGSVGSPDSPPRTRARDGGSGLSVSDEMATIFEGPDEDEPEDLTSLVAEMFGPPEVAGA